MVSPDSSYIWSEKSNRFCYALIVGCLALLVLSILIMAAVPPTSRDALTHHLAVPKLWIAHGGMIEMPDLVFSYYPMNLDLLYLVPLLFGNDILPKYIHFFFALSTTWLIYAFLKTRMNAASGLVGALFFLSIPVIVKLSINAYVDLGLVFFSWASIVYLCRWARPPHALKHLIFSALLCGLGLGTKYNGIIVLFLLTLFIPLLYIRTFPFEKPKKKCIFGFPLLFAFTALALFSPWMIKNYYLTGNPIFPLYNSHLNAEYGLSETTNMSMKPWLQRKLVYKEGALETALIPLRIFFQGKDDSPRFFDGRLNPILLFFPLVLFYRRKAPDTAVEIEIKLLGSFSVLFLLYASFMVDMRIRYIAPIIPPLVVLSVLGIRKMLEWIGQIDSKRMRQAGTVMLAGVIFFLLSLNTDYVKVLFKKTDPVPFILGTTTRREYLRDRLPDYPAIEFVNQIQGKRLKILALFLGKRLYYFNQPVVFGMQSFEKIVAEKMTEMTIASQLKTEGYTHCIIGINHFEAWANRVFNSEQKKLLSQWLRHECILLFSENGYAVYELKPNG